MSEKLAVLLNEKPVTSWAGTWAPGEYLTGQMVTDTGAGATWHCVANKKTTHRAAPQESGDPKWATELAGVFAPAILTANEPAYITGNRFTFGAATKINGYRWYCPDDTGNFTFEVWAADSAGNLQQYVAPVSPGAVGWYQIPFSALIAPGTVIDLMVVGRSVNQPNVFGADWDIKNANGNPNAGEANFQNSATEIRIHNEDKNGADQTANLQAVTVGGTIAFGGLTWTIAAVSIQGSHVRYTIQPNQGRPSEDTRTITFTWGASDPIPFAEHAAFWTGLPAGVTVTGFKDTTYPPAGQTADAYGADLNVDLLTDSEDWDILSFVGAGGGGGGEAGAEFFTDLGDTPENYAGEAGRAAVVKAAEDGLEFRTLPVTPIGGVELSYRWNSNTAATEPALGDVKANNADQTLATEVYISGESRFGNNVEFVIASINPGDYCGIYELVGDNESIYYAISGVTQNAGTVGADWFTLTVTAIPGNLGGIDDNKNVSFFPITNPENKLPPGGDAGQVLTKVSADDYDTYWAPGGGGSSHEYRRVNAATTAAAGEWLAVDSAGGAFTITLPPSAPAKTTVTVRDVGGKCSSNNVTLARNGATIDAKAEDFVIDLDWGQTVFVSDGAGNWQINPDVISSGPKLALINIQSATTTDFWATANVNWLEIPGLSVDIVPSSPTSRIMVFANVYMGTNTGHPGWLRLERDGVVLAPTPNSTGSSFTYAGGTWEPYTREVNDAVMNILDAPAASGPVTYRVTCRTSNAAGTTYINSWALNRSVMGPSSITVIEIP